MQISKIILELDDGSRVIIEKHLIVSVDIRTDTVERPPVDAYHGYIYRRPEVRMKLELLLKEGFVFERTITAEEAIIDESHRLRDADAGRVHSEP